MAAALSTTFSQADIRRAVASARSADIVVARLGVAAAGRIVIVATPPGSIPAEISEFDEAAE
jgi:hypothetical protein